MWELTSCVGLRACRSRQCCRMCCTNRMSFGCCRSDVYSAAPLPGGQPYVVCQHVRTSALVCPTALAPHGATPYKTTDAFSCAFVSDSSCIASQEPRSQRRLGRYKSSYVFLPGVVSLTPFAMAKPLLPRLAQASRAIAGPYSTARRTLSALQSCGSSPFFLSSCPSFRSPASLLWSPIHWMCECCRRL